MSRESSATNLNKKPIRTYIDGCFDIMHSGHYNAIRQAKQLTDILVVGVHSDAEILKHKGPPVMNEEERLATVRACKWVDEVNQKYCVWNYICC
jgi:ethanolamine-phosphate cytidylyltransferase